MYRLSGAVRRAERCIHWRSLLGDAASTQAQQAAPAAFAEASRQGAASLVRSMATRCSRAHSTHTAGAEQSAVVCACVLERLPIVLPPQPAWELEYQEWRYEKMRATYKMYPKELVEPKTVEEDESKQSWKPATPSLDSDALRSAERKPEDFVFLLVRKADGAWQFPQAALNEGETIRQVAERALAEAATGLDVYFVGNAPAAHHALSGSTLFFLRASYLGGSLQLPEQSGITDWAWVTKAELPQYVGKELQATLEQAL